LLADNKLALNAGWDKEILAFELQGLIDLDFEVELTGVSLAEIDEAGEADPDGADTPEDIVPVITAPVVTRRGDLWWLGRHKLICGDARERGLPEPAQYPHPDDVIIDLNAGTVRHAGPMTPDDEEEWLSMRARRDEAQSEVTCYADRYRRARDPRRKGLYLADWLREQKLLDILNDTMPKRWKIELAHRSYANGASRPGEFAKSVLAGEHQKAKRQGRAPISIA
jgi:hypothetical protein